MAGYELATVPAPKSVFFNNVPARFYLERATYYAQCLETNGINATVVSDLLRIYVIITPVILQ